MMDLRSYHAYIDREIEAQRNDPELRTWPDHAAQTCTAPAAPNNAQDTYYLVAMNIVSAFLYCNGKYYMLFLHRPTKLLIEYQSKTMRQALAVDHYSMVLRTAIPLGSCDNLIDWRVLISEIRNRILTVLGRPKVVSIAAKKDLVPQRPDESATPLPTTTPFVSAA